MYTDLGCWKDKNPRALTRLERKAGCDLNDHYRRRKNKIMKCYACAKKNSDIIVFALQAGGECWGGTDETSYKKYGASTNCKTSGAGGGLANHVYKLDQG